MPGGIAEAGHRAGAGTGSRAGRRAILLALAALAALRGGAGVAREPPRAPSPVATPLAGLPTLPPGAALHSLGGLVLDTAAIGFGGLSALHLDPALRLTAISDLGRFLTARLEMQEDGRPVGLADLRTGHLRDGAGAPLPRGYAADAESLARLPDGTWLVGFERWHRIRAYHRLDGPAAYVEAPPGLERAPRNGGLESLAVLADGRWLAIAERLVPESESGETLRRAWIGGPQRGWMPIAYRPGTPDLDPSDAAPLPDGGALVLERGFSVFGGFRSRLVRYSAEALAAATPGGVLEAGKELLRLEPPWPADNWEGVTAVRLAGGRTLVAMITDDNQNILQRTLLLLFELRVHDR